jgi:hypothetical protein
MSPLYCQCIVKHEVCKLKRNSGIENKPWHPNCSHVLKKISMILNSKSDLKK